MRKRIFQIIEAADDGDRISQIYDTVMLTAIILSLIPLAFKQSNVLFKIVDKVTVALFIIDYVLRWITADYKLNKNTPISFVKYPFTFMALVDLISILPSITVLNSTFRLLRMFRLARVMRAMKVFRIFKAARYSKSMEIIIDVFKTSKEPLMAVGTLSILYILISALVVFNVEPETFPDFFAAVYWATVSLTTVGYGDIYPVTVVGRIVTMCSSVFGIAVVALPAGIITAGYMNRLEEIEKQKKSNNKSDEADEDKKEEEQS